MPKYEVTGGFWVDPRDPAKRAWKGEQVDVPADVAKPAVEDGVLGDVGTLDVPVQQAPDEEPAPAPVKRGPGRPRKNPAPADN